MGMYIGDVYLPYVSDFSVDKAKKKTEIVKHCDRRVAPHLAEFQPDFREAKIAGTLLNGTVKTVDQYAEDILGAVDRSAAYNFIDFENRTGWLSPNDPDIPESADSVLRKYSLSGQFLPKAKYQPRFRTSPTIRANDFSLALGADGCDSYVALPVGATYSGGDGAAITRTGADGSFTLVKATTNNDIRFDVSGDEVDVGECKVWDTVTAGDTNEVNWVRVFNLDHEFSGDCVIGNGLIRRKFPTTGWVINAIKNYMYYNDTWNYAGLFDYWHSLRFNRIKTLSPDIIEVYIDKATAREGTIFSSSFTQKIPRGLGLIHSDGPDPYGKSNYALSARFGVTYDGDIADYLLDTAYVSTSLTNDNWILFFRTDVDLLVLQAFNVRGGTNFRGDGGCYGNANSEIFAIAQPFDTSKLFKECEAMTQGSGVTYYTGTDASPKTGNTGSTLNVSGENVEYSVIGDTDLPAGTYKLFVRAKDTAQVADDMRIEVYNQNDGVHLLNVTKTLTSAWAYYSGDVTLDADDAGDTIRVILKKDTATANTIDLDYVLWVPISLDSKNGPQDLAHQAMVDQRLTRELVGR